jgi:hypothetical protein
MTVNCKEVYKVLERSFLLMNWTTGAGTKDMRPLNALVQGFAREIAKDIKDIDPEFDVSKFLAHCDIWTNDNDPTGSA